MKLYKDKSFTQQSLDKLGLSFSDIFEELPIRIRNPHLCSSYLWELEDQLGLSSLSFDCLDLTTNPFLEKNLESLIDYIDEFANEQSKYQNYQRLALRQQVILQKRKSENATRRQQGEPELPEEDMNLRTTQPPSRLDNLLVTNQINNYCKQINQFAGHNFGKLFLIKGLENMSV